MYLKWDLNISIRFSATSVPAMETYLVCGYFIYSNLQEYT